MTSRSVGLAALALAAAGCASVAPQRAAADLDAALAGRDAMPVVWRLDAAAEARADAAVDSLLAQPLTPGRAAEIAVLNDRRLQAELEALAQAQAARVQAGLVANPVVGAGALFPLEGDESPELRFNVGVPLLDALLVPARRRVAARAYAAAELRAAGAVLQTAAAARGAALDAMRAEAQADLADRIAENAGAAYTAARLLREAGNVIGPRVLAEQAQFEAARLAAVRARADAAVAREHLAGRLGLVGRRAALDVPSALPPAGTTEIPGDLERRALDASLALAAARADVETAAARLGVAVPESVVPDAEVGAEAERRDGAWEAGPEVELVVPLFDAGQARRASLRSALRQARAAEAATATEVRAAARSAAARLSAAEAVARQLQTVVLPLRERLTAETLRQLNAMQVGVFELLTVQRGEAEAARQLLDALADAERARLDLGLLLAGGLPDGAAPMSGADGAAMPAAPAGADH